MQQGKSLSIALRGAVLGMREGAGMSYEEIEDVLGRSVSAEAIKRICYRAKVFLIPLD